MSRRGLRHEIHPVGPHHQRRLTRVGPHIDEFLGPFMQGDRQQGRPVKAAFAKFGMKLLGHVQRVERERLIWPSIAVDRPVIGKHVIRRMARSQTGDLPGAIMGGQCGIVSAKITPRGKCVEFIVEEDSPDNVRPLCRSETRSRQSPLHNCASASAAGGQPPSASPVTAKGPRNTAPAIPAASRACRNSAETKTKLRKSAAQNRCRPRTAL